jgi:hypothetical protein
LRSTQQTQPDGDRNNSLTMLRDFPLCSGINAARCAADRPERDDDDGESGARGDRGDRLASDDDTTDAENDGVNGAEPIGRGDLGDRGGVRRSDVSAPSLLGDRPTTSGKSRGFFDPNEDDLERSAW